MRYEWDSQKNRANIRQHGVDFRDVTQMLEQPLLGFYGGLHAMNKPRWIAVGWVHARLTLVVYTVRNQGDIVRIISARKATKRELKTYGQHY